MQTIPLIAVPNQELNVILEEQNCTVRVRQMGDYVFFSLWVDSDLIVENAICMPCQNILQFPGTSFVGNFLLIDVLAPDPRQSFPNYEEFGTRYALIYLNASDMEALEALRLEDATE